VYVGCPFCIGLFLLFCPSLFTFDLLLKRDSHKEGKECIKTGEFLTNRARKRLKERAREKEGGKEHRRRGAEVLADQRGYMVLISQALYDE
jgi:hypothetical protein